MSEDHPFDVAHLESWGEHLTPTQRANVLAHSRRDRQRITSLFAEMGGGRIMQLVEQVWRDSLPEPHKGGEFVHGPCRSEVVRCPGCKPARDAGEHCDWCCGAGHVTKRVAAVIEALPTLAEGGYHL